MNVTALQFTRVKKAAIEMTNAAYEDGKAQILDMRHREFFRNILDEKKSAFFNSLIDALEEDGNL